VFFEELEKILAAIVQKVNLFKIGDKTFYSETNPKPGISIISNNRLKILIGEFGEDRTV